MIKKAQGEKGNDPRKDLPEGTGVGGSYLNTAIEDKKPADFHKDAPPPVLSDAKDIADAKDKAVSELQPSMRNPSTDPAERVPEPEDMSKLSAEEKALAEELRARRKARLNPTAQEEKKDEEKKEEDEKKEEAKAKKSQAEDKKEEEKKEEEKKEEAKKSQAEEKKEEEKAEEKKEEAKAKKSQAEDKKEEEKAEEKKEEAKAKKSQAEEKKEDEEEKKEEAKSKKSSSDLVREANENFIRKHKKCMRIASTELNKNLVENPLKAELFDKFANLLGYNGTNEIDGHTASLVQNAIESAFDNAGENWFNKLMERTASYIGFNDESLVQVEATYAGLKTAKVVAMESVDVREAAKLAEASVPVLAKTSSTKGYRNVLDGAFAIKM